jgi:hypothetical protein
VYFEIQSNERGFILEDLKPVKYLTPGVHWNFSFFKAVKLEKYVCSLVSSDLDESRLALIPSEDLLVITLAEHERALVSKRGRPVLWLSAGVHQLWNIDRMLDGKTKELKSMVRVDVFDTSVIEAPLLSNEAAVLAKVKDYVEVIVPQGNVAIRYVNGKLDSLLPEGRHAAWNTMQNVKFSIIDLRERILAITGQEVMTRDRVSLRLNVSATFAVADAKRLASVAQQPDDLVYLAMQMSMREAVTTRTLDQLLEAREELAKIMLPQVKSKAESVGLRIVDLGVKDVVLPGDMKDLLNKVISAQKEAEANVIMRREETAATRSLAQTAKVLSENPLLVRLKELEAYKDLASKVGQVHLVLGEGALEKFSFKT